MPKIGVSGTGDPASVCSSPTKRHFRHPSRKSRCQTETLPERERVGMDAATPLRTCLFLGALALLAGCTSTSSVARPQMPSEPAGPLAPLAPTMPPPDAARPIVGLPLSPTAPIEPTSPATVQTGFSVPVQAKPES